MLFKIKLQSKNYLLEDHNHSLAFGRNFYFLLDQAARVILEIMRLLDLLTNDRQ